MRPVNLIPEEERRGGRAPMRSGPVAYLIVGAMLAALLGVSVLILTSNQISDSKAEVARLQTEVTATQGQAAQLAGYTQFQTVRDERVAAVTSLADSRFDWERVMRELSLILPSDVWLINLTGTVGPDVQPTGGAGVALRASIPGPALEMIGCATGQDAVARYVSALKDIDGITRVGVESSELTAAGDGTTGGGGGTDTSECRTKHFITKFSIVAAFDAAPVQPSTDPLSAAPTTSSSVPAPADGSTTDAAAPSGG